MVDLQYGHVLFQRVELSGEVLPLLVQLCAPLLRGAVRLLLLGQPRQQRAHREVMPLLDLDQLRPERRVRCLSLAQEPLPTWPLLSSSCSACSRQSAAAPSASRASHASVSFGIARISGVIAVLHCMIRS